MLSEEPRLPPSPAEVETLRARAEELWRALRDAADGYCRLRCRNDDHVRKCDLYRSALAPGIEPRAALAGGETRTAPTDTGPREPDYDPPVDPAHDLEACPLPDCFDCAVLDCPHGEPLHYDKGGCPACFPRIPTAPKVSSAENSDTAVALDPPNSDRWRVGRSLGRTPYLDDKLVGLMDTPELAAQVVAALQLKKSPPNLDSPAPGSSAVESAAAPPPGEETPDPLDPLTEIECDISKDSAWVGQYFCGIHCVWFRDSSDSDLDWCPAGQAIADALRAERAALAEERGRHEADRLERLERYDRLADDFHLAQVVVDAARDLALYEDFSELRGGCERCDPEEPDDMNAARLALHAALAAFDAGDRKEGADGE